MEENWKPQKYAVFLLDRCGLLSTTVFFFQFFLPITVEDAPEKSSWASTSKGDIGMSDDKATET
jgi:hypothetical protein